MEMPMPMRLRVSLMLTLGAVLSSCTVAVQPDTPASEVRDNDPAADIQAIRDLQGQLTLAYNTGDAELLASLHTRDVIRMPPGAEDVVGRAAVLEGNQRSFELAELELSNASDEIVVSGDLAFARGVARTTSTPKDGSAVTSSSTRYMHIYERQSDGGWLISQVIFNASGID